MYLIHTPTFIQNMFPNFVWRTSTQERVLYLTFDDGPIPEITPWVLAQLKQYNAKGTFFCVGENVVKHPEVFAQIKAGGHNVGNHTYNHLSGWATDNLPYFHNVRTCAELVDSDLFRPPYGRIKPRQAQFLMRHYKIVMWDVLSADFDPNISPEKCVENVMRTARPGSIIVMHDSIKAQDNLMYALPKVLQHFSKLGYSFKAIESSSLKVRAQFKRTA